MPELLFVSFQMTFAIITPALIAGAFAERMKFSASLLFFGLWHLIVYAPICHQVWGGGYPGLAGRARLRRRGGRPRQCGRRRSGLLSGAGSAPRLRARQHGPGQPRL
jgi:hypothetical protein